MSDNKKPKIVFDPEFFRNFNGSQEQLDELVSKIQTMLDSGSLGTFDQDAIVISDASDLITELDELEAELEEEAQTAFDLAAKKYGLDDNGFIRFPFPTIH